MYLIVYFKPWETIFFSDRRLIHEAKAVTGEMSQGPWVRDVIVNFIRWLYKLIETMLFS